VPRKKDPQVGIARAIRKARVEADCSQKDLAERLELNPSQVSRLEQGTSNPTWGTVRRVAAALDVDFVGLTELAEDFERRLGRESTI
jgi:transcriptional regulator with XRE-family HTH domain